MTKNHTAEQAEIERKTTLFWAIAQAMREAALSEIRKEKAAARKRRSGRRARRADT